MSRGWPVATLVSAVVAALVALSLPASANHPQTAHGDVLVFDHKTGNEWWVEVALSGGASGSVATVQAMDTGGTWVALTKRSWGAWAASFHIEPGHQVKFRATWSGGDMAESCWFDHPSGVERCSTSSSSTTTSSSSTTTGPGGFDASFTGVRGNEWWVQANVATNGPSISKVDVRLNGGAWMPLAKQSWGPTAWAASYHIVQGTIVQMRATAGTGAEDLSSCRQWIPPANQDATIVACPGSTPPPPPPPPQFDATWSNVKGNEYWVEAVVRANAPVQMVLVTIDCNPYQDGYEMTHRADWGKWVLGSIRIPAGSVITMEAIGPGGATDTSATYQWPGATIAEDCPPPWPQTGSSADIRFRDELREFDGEGGETYTMWDGLVHLEFTDGVGSGWSGTCEQLITHRDANGVWTNVTESYVWTRGPLFGLVPAGPPGSVASLETVSDCQDFQFESTVIGRERRTFTLRTSSGDPIAIDAYHAGDTGTSFFSDYWYDARLGLMLSWHEHSSSPHHTGSSRGWLLDTDAQFR